MLAQDVLNLEKENIRLKTELEDLKEKISSGSVAKPKSCRYCRHYIQHYGKSGGTYYEIHAGHCTCGVPVKKGGKRLPVPDDSCQYFEVGQR